MVHKVNLPAMRVLEVAVLLDRMTDLFVTESAALCLIPSFPIMMGAIKLDSAPRRPFDSLALHVTK